MKKLSLVFAMVFAASMAMAQHLSDVGQNGTGNTATVDQGFGASPGSALEGNKAKVNQAGDYNKAEIDQVNNGFGGSLHQAEISSVGNNNVAKIDQQLEDKGNAIITQIGNLNKATIVESGNFGAGHLDAPAYDAFAYQKGDKNTIDMTIFGDLSAAYAWQEGNSNTISQQVGEDVGQKARYSWVSAKQVGNSNTAIQYVEGEGFAGGITATWERARIIQNGDLNWAQQRQYDDILPATDNYAQAEQTGNSNASVQNQAGKSNQSWVFQNGFDNSTTVQIGTSNRVDVHQN